MGKYVALSKSFMISGIIGFFVSLFFIMQYSKDWGFALCIFFGFIFIASIISMNKAESGDPDHYAELAVHEKKIRIPEKTNKK